MPISSLVWQLLLLYWYLLVQHAAVSCTSELFENKARRDLFTPGGRHGERGKPVHEVLGIQHL